MDPYMFKRLLRRPWLSMCALVLSLTLCFLAGYLSDYRAGQEEKLAQTIDTFNIQCVVTDRSGTQSTSLHIPSMWVSFLRGEGEHTMSAHVRDLRLTREFDYTAWFTTDGGKLLGVNDVRCSEKLDPDLGANVLYFAENFYTRTDPVCIVSQEVYDQVGSDVIRLSVTDPHVIARSESDLGTGMAELTIVGCYAGSGTDIYIPYDSAMALSSEISNRTGDADAIAFYAADNQALEELAEAAGQMFGPVDPLAGEHESLRFSLVIQDQQYRATVAVLEQNIERTGYLLPLVLAMGLALGFLISFLSTRGEKLTYALMRSLGLTRGRLVVSILGEQLIFPAVSVLVMGAWLGAWAPMGVYLVFYCGGCALCVIRSLRVSPTAILREQE